jgi:hypothetical protein
MSRRLLSVGKYKPDPAPVVTPRPMSLLAVSGVVIPAEMLEKSISPVLLSGDDIDVVAVAAVELVGVADLGGKSPPSDDVADFDVSNAGGEVNPPTESGLLEPSKDPDAPRPSSVMAPVSKGVGVAAGASTSDGVPYAGETSIISKAPLLLISSLTPPPSRPSSITGYSEAVISFPFPPVMVYSKTLSFSEIIEVMDRLSSSVS